MDGSDPMVLAEADISALREIGWRPPEEFVVKAADGETDVHGLMYKPHDFDPSRKYPLIEIIYAGSQMPAVPRRFVPSEYGHFAQVLAQLDFVTVVLDAPGTPGRNKAFQDVVYRSIGRNEIPDHVAAIKQIAESRPYMDLDRVGIFGGSWGGYMTVRGMLTAPEFYRVGIASALVADLYDHTLNLEWYVGLPQDNREVYDYASNLLLADQLQGQLLLIHGTLDLNNAPFSSTMKLVDAFIRAGKPFDLLVIPEMAHDAERPDHVKYLNDTRFRYFTEHLHPERVVPVQD